MPDIAQELRGRVLEALVAGTPLDIKGSGSKSFYGRPAQGMPCYMNAHNGIINYEPSELVITARSGTRLADIEALLGEHGQMLAFEPPYFGPGATLGGAVATGLSGPRRPHSGSVRDAVLGVKVLDGHGEILKFGGEVIKNVAGFDMPRLMVGALGTLGILLEVSLKVLPRPEQESTLVFSLGHEAALRQMNRWAGQNWPITAASYDGELVRIRLSGAEAALAQATLKLGGDLLGTAEAEQFWSNLREQRLAFFQGETPLWRLSLAPAAPQPELSGLWLIDWGGALRWLKSEQEPETIFYAAQALGGHACRFRSTSGGEFQPLPASLEKLHRDIKKVFDPHGIFNAGRLYPGW